MALVVQKFGGSSVEETRSASSGRRRAIHARQAGNQVIVVVKAPEATPPTS